MKMEVSKFIIDGILYQTGDPIYGFWLDRNEDINESTAIIKYNNKWYVYYLVEADIVSQNNIKLNVSNDNITFIINDVEYVGKERLVGVFIKDQNGIALIEMNGWYLFYPTPEFEVKEKESTVCNNFNNEPVKISTEYILDRYQPITYLGEGSFGKVVKVLDKEKDKILAMKIPIEDYGFREVEYNCKILSLTKDYTDCFAEVISWYLIEDGIVYNYNDNSFSKNMQDNEVTTMPIYDKSYNPEDPQFSDNEISIDDIKYGFIFELFIAVTILNQKGFIHGDLQYQNILTKNVSYDRVYNINGQNYIIRNKFIPIIIDFGLSIKIDDTIYQNNHEDFKSIIDLMRDFDLNQPPVDIYLVGDYILNHPMFDKFKTDNPTGRLLKFFNRLNTR